MKETYIKKRKEKEGKNKERTTWDITHNQREKKEPS
jgi:hypothetical protein